ncbi:DNA polymerase III subunit epsilon [Chiayiivirga flava]|uniref:DNA polymerase III subunit epsilon n=1 Tax=Chiayiivirga flava TaxID=659595 RepID=A0A7W8G1N2_9GAMM|nr:DNA polymerase III subunit epsilon [Chiayiivirga flava]MBB5209048.1 DNA polymerase-3 subunit epsilon [Chiayiivirga flava]
MRQIVLDTETTGLSWEKGNRVVEIGCVELVERRPTGRTFQRYLKPDCAFEPGAQEVTGLSLEFLADKPIMQDVVDEFLDFIRGAELIIHNAAFDVGFLDAELSRCGAHYGRLSEHAVVFDTLSLARERFPGQRNSLDALCKRFDVDNSHRDFHGALLDAQLLADVYLALTSGQGDLGFSLPQDDRRGAVARTPADVALVVARVRCASAEDEALHRARLERIAKVAGHSLWPLAAADAPALPA